MSRQRPLEGACHCGRNHYAIIIPEDTTERAQVYFDDGSESSIFFPLPASPSFAELTFSQDEVKQLH